MFTLRYSYNRVSILHLLRKVSKESGAVTNDDDPRLQKAKPANPPEFWSQLWQSYGMLDTVANECLHALLKDAEVDAEALVRG